MLEFIKDELNMTQTENGAATYASTGSNCLDLFATVGALRHSRDDEIITRFLRAYDEDADTAMKLLFFARDIRGGLGERRVFRVVFNWLASNKPESVLKNIEYVDEYGRFDDLLSLMGTPCEKKMITLVGRRFKADIAAFEKGETVSLLAKWLPSVNASNAVTRQNGKKFARAFGMNDAQYRKTLSALRAKINIIENNLREKDYSFDYGKQTSRAMFKYRSAFLRNDKDRYLSFINDVSSGKAVLHSDNVAPYELIEPYINTRCYCRDGSISSITPEEKHVLNARWASLPDFGSNENALAVIDTSGSMYCATEPIPAAVALSLGLYFAEHNTGEFKNHFIEFSHDPQLIEIKGETFSDRLEYIMSFNEIADTNLEAVFNVILRAAVNNNVSQSEMPAKLIIISDMEFNACVNNADAVIFQNAKDKYKAHGYTLPQIVFWNVASRNRQQPVTQNEQGVALVSGVTPRLFSMIAGGILSPYAFMKEVTDSPRYAKIAA